MFENGVWTMRQARGMMALHFHEKYLHSTDDYTLASLLETHLSLSSQKSPSMQIIALDDSSILYLVEPRVWRKHRAKNPTLFQRLLISYFVL